MPFLTEDDLLNLHKEIDTQKEKAEELEEEQESLSEQNATLKKTRLFLAIISGVLGLLLLTSLVSYFVFPGVLLNKSSLEKNGQYIMSEEDYNNAQEAIAFKENTETTKAAELNQTTNIEKPIEESIEETTIYAVQIKAFKEKHIQLYSNNLIQFREFYEDEFYKYTIGAFETLEEARQFRKDILKLGFKDAFVASYKNGERIKIEEPNGSNL